jgi:hypothetical protein
MNKENLPDDGSDPSEPLPILQLAGQIEIRTNNAQLNETRDPKRDKEHSHTRLLF